MISFCFIHKLVNDWLTFIVWCHLWSKLKDVFRQNVEFCARSKVRTVTSTNVYKQYQKHRIFKIQWNPFVSLISILKWLEYCLKIYLMWKTLTLRAKSLTVSADYIVNQSPLKWTSYSTLIIGYIPWNLEISSD